MTKQEEIREGIARQLYYWLTAVYRNEDNVNETTWDAISEKDRKYYREYYADPFMKTLNSQGVVIKVKRELPEPGYMVAPGWKKVGWHSACNYMKRTGWEAVEPLIEELTNAKV